MPVTAPFAPSVPSALRRRCSAVLLACALLGPPVLAGEAGAADGGRAADLAVRLTAPGRARAGHPYTYTVTVTNHGRAAAARTVVRLARPRGAYTVSATPQAKRPTVDELSWDAGTLAAGQQRTFRVTVRPKGQGVGEAVAKVTSATFDPVTGNNTVTARTAVSAR